MAIVKDKRETIAEYSLKKLNLKIFIDEILKIAQSREVCCIEKYNFYIYTEENYTFLVIGTENYWKGAAFTLLEEIK